MMISPGAPGLSFRFEIAAWDKHSIPIPGGNSSFYISVYPPCPPRLVKFTTAQNDNFNS